MVKETTKAKGFDGLFLLKNTVFGFLATGIFLLVAALAATYFGISNPVIDLLVLLVTGISVLWIGFRAARHTGRQGLLQGILAGVTYLGFLYLIGSLSFGEWSMETTTGFSMHLGIGCGGIGGIFGANMKRKRKR